jgi:aminopeptidase YwaD
MKSRRTLWKMRRRRVGLALLPALLVACSAPAVRDAPAPGPVGPASPSSSPAESPEPSPTPEPRPPRPVAPRDFDVRRAVAVVDHLAGELGPRHGTSPAFDRAAGWVAGRLGSMGYEVARRGFRAPAGVSWGVPVAAGRSENIVAAPRGLEPDEPHLVVGAHLDTVPQAPGAEDNGSGVGVLLAAAEAVAERSTRLPVVWVAFGAEEPRGPTDDDHHYGSRAYVATMAPAERRAMRGMVSLDRVGVGSVVPVGSATDGDPVQRSLLAAGRRAGVPVVPDPGQRSSDHWSFVRAGLPAARLGSTPYAAYHSADDRPGVVEPAQLERTGRLLLGWLAPQGAR